MGSEMCIRDSADLPGGAGVPLRREAGVLLVADEVVRDLRVVEHVVEGEGHAAGVSEEAIDAFPEEALTRMFAPVMRFDMSGPFPGGSANAGLF